MDAIPLPTYSHFSVEKQWISCGNSLWMIFRTIYVHFSHVDNLMVFQKIS